MTKQKFSGRCPANLDGKKNLYLREKMYKDYTFEEIIDLFVKHTKTEYHFHIKDTLSSIYGNTKDLADRQKQSEAINNFAGMLVNSGFFSPKSDEWYYYNDKGRKLLEYENYGEYKKAISQKEFLELENIRKSIVMEQIALLHTYHIFALVGIRNGRMNGLSTHGRNPIP